MSTATTRLRTLVVLLLTVTALTAQTGALAQRQRPASSSLLLLIDASGSMGDPVGAANPQVKIDAAKRAATDALSRAAGGGSVEVAVLAFSGDCQHPVPHYQDFTRDVGRLTRFIDSLQPGGGTPMADALLFANRYMQSSGSARASDRMIMLLADGQNDCGDVGQALAALQRSGVIFRHETVGFGITPNSVGGAGPAPGCHRDRGHVPPCRRRQPARRRVHGVRRHVVGDRHAGPLRPAGTGDFRRPDARRVSSDG